MGCEGEIVAAVKAFFDEYGELPKGQGDKIKGEEKRLATFWCAQRHFRGRGKLSPDQIAAMESNPGFEWDGRVGRSASKDRIDSMT